MSQEDEKLSDKRSKIAVGAPDTGSGASGGLAEHLSTGAALQAWTLEPSGSAKHHVKRGILLHAGAYFL